MGRSGDPRWVLPSAELRRSPPHPTPVPAGGSPLRPSPTHRLWPPQQHRCAPGIQLGRDDHHEAESVTHWAPQGRQRDTGFGSVLHRFSLRKAFLKSNGSANKHWFFFLTVYFPENKRREFLNICADGREQRHRERYLWCGEQPVGAGHGAGVGRQLHVDWEAVGRVLCVVSLLLCSPQDLCPQQP